jgi:hypothetical protein
VDQFSGSSHKANLADGSPGASEPKLEDVRSAADAESLVDELTRLGETRHYAKRTFLVFVVIVVLLAIVTVVVVSR